MWWTLLGVCIRLPKVFDYCDHPSESQSSRVCSAWKTFRDFSNLFFYSRQTKALECGKLGEMPWISGVGGQVHVLSIFRPYSIVNQSKSVIYFICWVFVSNSIRRKKREKKGGKNAPRGRKGAICGGMVWVSHSQKGTFGQKPEGGKKARSISWGRSLEAEGIAPAKILRQERAWPSPFEHQWLNISFILWK